MPETQGNLYTSTCQGPVQEQCVQQCEQLMHPWVARLRDTFNKPY